MPRLSGPRLAILVLSILAAVAIFKSTDREPIPQPAAPLVTADVLPVASAPVTLPTNVEQAPNTAPVNSAELAQSFPAQAAPTPATPDFNKIEAFDGWIHRWDAATVDQKKELVAEGRQLAVQRRPAFKSLIATDPRMALEKAVPRRILQDLPVEIAEQLEKPVSTVGDFRVYRGRPQTEEARPAEGLTLRYFETANGESFKARVFGAREQATSKKDLPLSGVAIDREFAVAESPVRPLEIGERVAANVSVEQTCPVSGQTTEIPAPEEPISEETPDVEVGGRVIHLCNGTHVKIVDEH